ncbi:hypothetical protein GCM10022281_17240 [Sphingomonas rosea]|uniref:DUF465 domain-containing protein n=1 Tax=Sphingomonas rosea TaxID=335605 RepID=A0ABP7U713_9SPHN
MSTHAIRLNALRYDIERALDGELRKSRPDPLRIFRLRRVRATLKERFNRLFRRRR